MDLSWENLQTHLSALLVVKGLISITQLYYTCANPASRGL